MGNAIARAGAMLCHDTYCIIATIKWIYKTQKLIRKAAHRHTAQDIPAFLLFFYFSFWANAIADDGVCVYNKELLQF